MGIHAPKLWDLEKDLLNRIQGISIVVWKRQRGLVNWGLGCIPHIGMFTHSLCINIAIMIELPAHIWVLELVVAWEPVISQEERDGGWADAARHSHAGIPVDDASNVPIVIDKDVLEIQTQMSEDERLILGVARIREGLEEKQNVEKLVGADEAQVL